MQRIRTLGEISLSFPTLYENNTALQELIAKVRKLRTLGMSFRDVGRRGGFFIGGLTYLESNKSIQ